MPDDRKRALVTGGAGFIGSHIAGRLSHDGWEVVVYDDFSTGLRDNLEGIECEIVEGSILDADLLASAARGGGALFHLAASVSVPFSVDNPRASFDANAAGTLNVLEAARSAGMRRVIYSASSAAYGERPESPKRETLAPQALSVYAAGKLAGEHLVSSYANSYGMQTISLRYFNIFGPRQRHDSPYAAVIPIFLGRLREKKPLVVYGDGEQTRDFTYIDNVVDANLLAVQCDSLNGECLNIACGESISLNDLISELGAILGVKPVVEFEPARPGDVKHSSADTSSAQRILGYSPSVNWRDGLRRTISSFLGE